jgi:hypothetical protein
MNKELADRCAQQRANKTKRPYVAIKARNGRWMVESEESVKENYPASAKRQVFNPIEELS